MHYRAEMFAVSCALAKDRPGAREPTRPEAIFESYAKDLVKERGGSDSRPLWAAAWTAESGLPSEREWPVR